MATMYAAQQEVIVALTDVGEADLAGCLERCLQARGERRGGDGWPFTCRSAACVWCRRPLIRAWWNGMCQWSAATTTSLAIIPLHSSAGRPDAVRRMRRGCATFETGWRVAVGDGMRSALLAWPVVPAGRW
jgi:hypothetical protein